MSKPDRKAIVVIWNWLTQYQVLNLLVKKQEMDKEFQPLWKMVYILKYKNYLGVVYFIYIISIL